MNARADLNRLSRVLRPYWRTYVLAYVAALTAAVCHLTIPWLIGRGVMAALGHDQDGFVRLVILFLGTVAILVAASLTDQVSRQAATRAVVHDLRAQLFDAVQRLCLVQLERRAPGDIIARVQRDVGVVQEVMDTSSSVLSDVIFLTGALLIMARLNLLLAAVVLMILGGYLILRVKGAAKMAGLYRRASNTAATLDIMLAENIAGRGVVQAARREGINAARFAAAAQENYRAQALAGWAGGFQVGFAEIVGGACAAAVLLLGAWSMSGRAQALADLITALLYAQRLVDPVRSLNIQFNLAQRAAAAARRIGELLDEPAPSRTAPAASGAKSDRSTLTFENVTFGYDGDRPVLHQVSFRVGPAQTLAVVGPTGSGKSTLAALAAGLLTPGAGKVELDGEAVETIDRAGRARTVVMAPQDPFLFSGTVAENIGYGAERPSPEQLRAAAVAVGADAFIARLSQGYETPVLTGGSNLSAGQRQLIGLARALLRQPSLLILDEPTALLDSETEAWVRSGISRLMSGRTCLVIAHRLATVRHADEILVLKDGRIAERGRHDDLLATGGAYAQLVAAAQRP